MPPLTSAKAGPLVLVSRSKRFQRVSALPREVQRTQAFPRSPHAAPQPCVYLEFLSKTQSNPHGHFPNKSFSQSFQPLGVPNASSQQQFPLMLKYVSVSVSKVIVVLVLAQGF